MGTWLLNYIQPIVTTAFIDVIFVYCMYYVYIIKYI